MIYFYYLILSLTLILGCSSIPIKPEDIKVKVSREAPSKDCQNIGTVLGSTLSVNGTSEHAIEDLKQDAARKGANYVQIETFSAYGNTAKGTAFICP